MTRDHVGLPYSGATPDGLRGYEAALHQLSCYVDDPVAAADEAIAASPGMPMGHVLRAWLHLLGTEPTGIAVAQSSCATAAALPANERERQHLRAASLLGQGHWHAAARVLEDLSPREPHDLLALIAGHQLDFFTGDSRMLRDRIARALTRWDHAMPGYHSVLSMHAFGLEETADYVAAERAGRRALELEPRDGWAWHAVAHVHEMRHEPQAGVRWLADHRRTWSEGSFFAVHNTWHLALFQLELDRVDEVLRLYDEAIGGTGSSLMLDLVDATAMLWRLRLRDIDAGERWQALAQRWRECATPGLYAFNDFHFMLALVGAGQEAGQRELLQAQADACERDDGNARFTREVGEPATRAIHAFGQGDYAGCAARLRDIRSRSHAFGGSHAQRDVIDLTLIGAAERSGDGDLARGLRDERALRRPGRY
ncbi:tetratricopeptide repeat protein [Ramlibacter sp. AW1]|uniref:Tetratricopeptide repeat protein 38 n=1 Tax=Ramlibacter aurantiacus TaxID=2801330 RepID=A0A936ZKN8_9BURK|nr:tetratricopeptide repeat protein [Ramlibacter aurantiacus]MBL0418975.1 tetratricopeptide repeat protein [Ramlibacter aurantiacus]